MNLLLDTHAFLWFVVASLNHFLPQPTRDLLEDGANQLYLSVASVWETAIKVSIGKLRLPLPVTQIVSSQVQTGDIELLNIKLTHLDLIETMALHHKDPFDRLLIAQAQVENFSLVSTDVAFDSYGVNRVWLT
jgi:PIN domain nuclease of toxin-antitoxin system